MESLERRTSLQPGTMPFIQPTLTPLGDKAVIYTNTKGTLSPGASMVTNPWGDTAFPGVFPELQLCSVLPAGCSPLLSHTLLTQVSAMSTTSAPHTTPAWLHDMCKPFPHRKLCVQVGLGEGVRGEESHLLSISTGTSLGN